MNPAKARKAARIILGLRQAHLHLLVAEVGHNKIMAAHWRAAGDELARKMPVSVQSPLAQAAYVTQPVLRILAKRGVLGVAEAVRA